MADDEPDLGGSPSSSSDGDSRPGGGVGFMFGNTDNKLRLEKYEMPEVQREAKDFERLGEVEQGAGAIGRELSAQGGEQEKHRVKKASDAHDYFDLEEIAEDNAPAEPARDEENVPGAPPTNERSVELDGNYAESESNRANSGQGSTFNSVPPGFEASGGVLKFQATFMPQWRIPSIETIRARYKKGYDEGAEQRGGESATQEENPFFEDQDEDLDFDKELEKELEEENVPNQEPAVRHDDEASKESLDVGAEKNAEEDEEEEEEDEEEQEEQDRRFPVGLQREQQAAETPFHQQKENFRGERPEDELTGDFEEVIKELSSDTDDLWFGNALPSAVNAVDQVDWERCVNEGEEPGSSRPTGKNVEENVSLEPLTVRETPSDQAENDRFHADLFRLHEGELSATPEQLKAIREEMQLDRRNFVVDLNNPRLWRTPFKNLHSKGFFDGGMLDMNDPQLVLTWLDQGSEEQFRGSASAIMQSLTSRSKEIKQSEREGDKVAEDNSESARLLSTLQKYNISNDELYAEKMTEERASLTPAKGSNRMGPFPDINHATPANKLLTTPPTPSEHMAKEFHRPRPAFYPPHRATAVQRPVRGNELHIHVRTLSPGTENVELEVSPKDTFRSLQEKASPIFEKLKGELKLYVKSLNVKARPKRVSSLDATFEEEGLSSHAIVYVVSQKVHILKTAKANSLPRSDKPRTPPAAFTQKSDFSACEGHIFLTEYIEEHPLLLSTRGMGAKRVLFYKKRTSGDARGKELSQKYKYKLQEMEPRDKATPFLSPLSPGRAQTTLETKLYRAPIYENTPRSTDFLLIRQSNGRFLVREFSGLYAAGYMEPHEVVPSPGNHQDILDYYDLRVQAYVFRLAREQQTAMASAHPAISVSDVVRLFPQNYESMIRKRLRTFTEQHPIHGHDDLWHLRQGFNIPPEEIIRQKLSPERVCCMEAMQAGIEKLRAAKLFNYDLYAYNNTQQLMNAISQLCQDEHLGKACQVVESELLSTPWVQTSEFHQALQGKIALDLNPSKKNLYATGRLFNYVRKRQRSKEEQGKSEGKSSQQGPVTGTNKDLRKLSMQDAAHYMRLLGCSEELIKSTKRWERINIIRELSKEARKEGRLQHLDLGRFVRDARVSFSQQRQEQEENAAKLSRRQASALQQKNSVTALVGGHSEHSAEEDSESESEGVSGEGTKREEGKAQTASQGQEEEEGEELQTLRRMLHDDKKKKKLRLKMIVTRPSPSGQRQEVTLLADDEVASAYKEGLAESEEKAKEKALAVVNARKGMSDQETGLPGVRPMKFLKKGVKMPKPKAIRMKAGEYSHQVLFEQSRQEDTSEERASKMPRQS